MKKLFLITIILILIVAVAGIAIKQRIRNKSNNAPKNNTTGISLADQNSNQPVNQPSAQPLLAEPIADFASRITKKPFGIYITPQNSPVQPEKFTGYHTGADIEYQDAASEVNVYSIYDGEIISSGYVNGYGGTLIVSYDIKGEKILALYGHLNPESLASVDTKVKRGEKIAILGIGYSSETAGERKHLHFGIIKGEKINYLGYVPNQQELSLWYDPLKFIEKYNQG